MEIKLTQGTKEWLSWRDTIITGTDAAVIMKLNPWVTARDLLQRKLSLISPIEENDLMRRGKELEPVALREFEMLTNLVMEPVCWQNDRYRWIGASVDGVNLLRTKALEIKCGSEKLHQLAKKHILPPYYKAQVQHIMLCLGLEWMYYMSFRGEGVIVEVERDDEFCEELLDKSYKFWQRMMNFDFEGL